MTDPTAALWQRLHRPFHAAGAVEAMSGLSPMASRALVGLGLAVSAEAEQLLGNIAETVRSLAIATTSRPVRSVGEVRGPVLWSETLAARAASPGAGEVFICAAPSKAYDTDENRVLVHALKLIRDAARDADKGVPAGPSEVALGPAVARARFNGSRATQAMEHRTLTGVPRVRPDGRAVRKARTGNKARSYRGAVAVLDRAGEPIGAEAVIAYSDPYTRQQHALLLALHDRLRQRGAAPERFRVEHSTLRAGPLRYLHRHRPESDGIYGVLLGRLLVDVPDTRVDDPVAAEVAMIARAGGHPSLMVLRPSDVDRAIALAESSG